MANIGTDECIRCLLYFRCMDEYRGGKVPPCAGQGEPPKPAPNSDYAAALRVIEDYYSQYNDNVDLSVFMDHVKERLHSEEPNVA